MVLFKNKQIPSYYHSGKKCSDNYFEYVNGLLKAFIDLRKSIKEEVTFTLISFENEVSDEFKEWIENFGICLLPKPFKNHVEIQSYLSTVRDFLVMEDISYAPYIDDTRKLLYYLERETGANVYVEEQNNFMIKHMKEIFKENENRL